MKKIRATSPLAMRWLEQNDVEVMWWWYAVPAIVMSFLIFNIAICMKPGANNGRHEIYPTVSGVDRAEIVSRWDQ